MLVNDYFGGPACYYAGTVQEAAEQFAKDVEGFLGWRPNVRIDGERVIIRYYILPGGFDVAFDGKEEFDREVWLIRGDWDEVLVPAGEEEVGA